MAMAKLYWGGTWGKDIKLLRTTAAFKGCRIVSVTGLCIGFVVGMFVVGYISLAATGDNAYSNLWIILEEGHLYIREAQLN